MERRIVTMVSCALLLSVTPVGCDLPDPDQTHSVQYKVGGSAPGADITIQTPSGTEQHSVTPPWTSDTYTFKGLDFAYISAQNHGERGTVRVELVVNGSTVKSASATSPYGIASTDWLVGSDRE